MSDKSTLVRLLRELNDAHEVNKHVSIEKSIVGLFDAVQDELYKDIERLRKELDEAKYETWLADQANASLQDQLQSYRALNLYDLVGDTDELRDEMVTIAQERNRLRVELESARHITGELISILTTLEAVTETDNE